MSRLANVTMKHEQQRTAFIYSIFIFKQRVREQHTVAQPFTVRLNRKLMWLDLNNVIESKD